MKRRSAFRGNIGVILAIAFVLLILVGTFLLIGFAPCEWFNYLPASSIPGRCFL